jgi:hypothetical protein
VERNDRYLLIVRADQKKEEEVSDLILLFFKGKAIMRAKNLSGGVIEMIYELSSGILARSEQNESITNKLSETEGVYAVNLVCQNDEVNR